MSTYRELVYLVLDELRLTSDDALFNEEHVMFLLVNTGDLYSSRGTKM